MAVPISGNSFLWLPSSFVGANAGLDVLKLEDIEYVDLVFEKNTAFGTDTAPDTNDTDGVEIYQGGWRNGQPEGEGRYTWADQSYYLGSWHRGEKHGWGKYAWPNGATYLGEWKSNTIHGYGTLSSPDGSRYQGYFANNLREGIGTRWYANGDRLEGIWKANLPNGPGRYVFKLPYGSGVNEYNGELRGGKFEGQGTFKWTSGHRYDGEYKGGVPHGIGVWTWPDGSTYEGFWEGGVRHGVGVFRPWSGVTTSMTRQQYHRHTTTTTTAAAAVTTVVDGSSIPTIEATPTTPTTTPPSTPLGGVYSSTTTHHRRPTEAAIAELTGEVGHVYACEFQHGELVQEEAIQPEDLVAVFGQAFSKHALGVVRGVAGGGKRLMRGRSRGGGGSRRREDRMGETIFKGSRSYDLMLNLQLGIRYTLATLSKLPPPDRLLPQHFDEKVWLKFPRQGSELTPPHPSQDFKWKDYASHVFRHLRSLFAISNSEYILSTCGDHALRELASPGKSGSVFFVSQDERFIIKTMRKEEVKLLLRALPEYHAHVAAHPDTLLTRFYGVHRIQPAGGRKVRFVVMNNIFATALPFHEKYDLKGSTYRRTAGPAPKPGTVLKDLDLKACFHLRGEELKRLQGQLEADASFLEAMNVMDYSLLLGVHYRGRNTSARSGSGGGGGGGGGANATTHTTTRMHPSTITTTTTAGVSGNNALNIPKSIAEERDEGEEEFHDARIDDQDGALVYYDLLGKGRTEEEREEGGGIEINGNSSSSLHRRPLPPPSSPTSTMTTGAWSTDGDEHASKGTIKPGVGGEGDDELTTRTHSLTSRAALSQMKASHRRRQSGMLGRFLAWRKDVKEKTRQRADQANAHVVPPPDASSGVGVGAPVPVPPPAADVAPVKGGGLLAPPTTPTNAAATQRGFVIPQQQQQRNYETQQQKLNNNNNEDEQQQRFSRHRRTTSATARLGSTPTLPPTTTTTTKVTKSAAKITQSQDKPAVYTRTFSAKTLPTNDSSKPKKSMLHRGETYSERLTAQHAALVASLASWSFNQSSSKAPNTPTDRTSIANDGDGKTSSQQHPHQRQFSSSLDSELMWRATTATIPDLDYDDAYIVGNPHPPMTSTIDAPGTPPTAKAADVIVSSTNRAALFENNNNTMRVGVVAALSTTSSPLDQRPSPFLSLQDTEQSKILHQGQDQPPSGDDVTTTPTKKATKKKKDRGLLPPTLWQDYDVNDPEAEATISRMSGRLKRPIDDRLARDLLRLARYKMLDPGGGGGRVPTAVLAARHLKTNSTTSARASNNNGTDNNNSNNNDDNDDEDSSTGLKSSWMSQSLSRHLPATAIPLLDLESVPSSSSSSLKMKKKKGEGKSSSEAGAGSPGQALSGRLYYGNNENNNADEQHQHQSTQEKEQVTLFLGIIDWLQPYNARKRVEHGLKSVVLDSRAISVCEPRSYARRFMGMVHRVFQPYS